MSWYKKAQSPNIQFLSYNSYGNLKVLINGKPYTYYEVSPTIKDKIEWMINNYKIPRGVILNQLKPYSNIKRHQDLNSKIPPRIYYNGDNRLLAREVVSSTNEKNKHLIKRNLGK